MVKYIVDSLNAHMLAERMSNELQGEVTTVSKVHSVDVRRDENGLDNTDWRGESAKQPLPVKVTDVSLMWTTGNYVFTIGFDEVNSYICFPAKNVVVVSQYSPAGNLVLWTFVGSGK